MCGIFGIINHKSASHIAYYGIHALQHRGQESAGIVSSNGREVYARHGMGLVSDVFPGAHILNKLEGDMAIGHNRYSTTGASSEINIQPLLFKHHEAFISIAHNGNLINLKEPTEELEDEGALFKTSTDTEIIVHFIVRSIRKRMTLKIQEALNRIQGAYSLLIMTRDAMYVARDPLGLRPMAIGRKDGAWVFSSETSSFDLIGAEYVRDVRPGELIRVGRGSDEMKSTRIAKKETPKHCIFELIYFSRPDSKVYGDMVDRTRRKLGKVLALENDEAEKADIVVSVPDSSNTIAIGYSRRSGIKYEISLIRNHYVGRTFISPEQGDRDMKVHLKFNPIRGTLKDREIILVDDSIVRGTTLKKLIRLLKDAGAAKVHVRIASPPIKHPCYYGLDFPTSEELIANGRSNDEIRDAIGADSLRYLSVDGMLSAMVKDKEHFCTACFTGNYPLQVRNNGGNKTMYVNEIS